MGMTREEKGKLLDLMGKERNSYAEHLRIEEAKLIGKIAGADYMLNRLLNYLQSECEVEDENVK